jgi:hypothetical protein
MAPKYIVGGMLKMKCRPTVYRPTETPVVVPGVSVTYTYPALLTTDIIGTRCFLLEIPDPIDPTTGAEQVILNIGGEAMNATAFNPRFGGNRTNVPVQRLRPAISDGCRLVSPVYVAKIEFSATTNTVRILRGLRRQRIAATA